MIKRNNIPKDLNITTLIFDIDYTLIRHITFKELLSEKRIVLFPLFDQIIVLLFSGINNSKYFESFYNKLTSLFKSKRDMLIWLKKIIYRIEKEYVRLIPNVKATMEKLSADYRIFCFSDFFYESAKNKIDLIGIDEIVSDIFITGNGRKKINIESYMDLFDAFKNFFDINPDNVAIVGNSIVDVYASKLGCNTILVDYDDKVSNQDLRFSCASAVVTDFSDLCEVLSREKEKR